MAHIYCTWCKHREEDHHALSGCDGLGDFDSNECGCPRWHPDHQHVPGPHGLGEIDAPRNEIDVALNELYWLTGCRCDEAWTSRNLHGPDCKSDYREDLTVLADALGRKLPPQRDSDGDGGPSALDRTGREATSPGIESST